METILQLLTSTGGAFAVIAALIFLAFWVVVKVSTITANHSSFSNNLSESRKHIDDIRTDIAYLKGAINIILKDDATQRKSPITLTELGEKIKNDNDLVGLLARNWEKVSAKMICMNGKNPYDIQQFCVEHTFTALDEFFSKEDVDILKTIAFKSGLQLMSITRIMGVLIRDEYFKRNGIDAKDVDKYDPNKVKQ